MQHIKGVNTKLTASRYFIKIQLNQKMTKTNISLGHCKYSFTDFVSKSMHSTMSKGKDI